MLELGENLFELISMINNFPEFVNHFLKLKWRHAIYLLF